MYHMNEYATAQTGEYLSNFPQLSKLHVLQKIFEWQKAWHLNSHYLASKYTQKFVLKTNSSLQAMLLDNLFAACQNRWYLQKNNTSQQIFAPNGEAIV